MINTITKDMLVEAKACKDQVQLFTKIFPDGARVNKTNALKADKAGLCIDWAASNLLSSDKNGDYRAKRKLISDDYDAKRKPLLGDYEAKHKPILDDYEAKHKPLRGDYRAKIKLIWDDYRAKHKPINDDYEAKIALLFVEIYNS